VAEYRDIPRDIRDEYRLDANAVNKENTCRRIAARRFATSSELHRGALAVLLRDEYRFGKLESSFRGTGIA